MARLFNGLNQFRSQERIGDLSTLCHHRHPGWQLGVILGESDRSVVSVLAELAHGVLVHDSPNERVIGRVVHLQGRRIPGRNRHQILLLAIERIGASLHTLGWRGPALKEEAERVVHQIRNRVLALGQFDRNVNKRNVLSARSISNKLLRSLLLEHVFQFWSHRILSFSRCLVNTTESDDRKLVPESGSMGLRPVPSLASVLPRTPNMADNQENNDRHDHCFLDKVLGRRPLPDPVPFRIGDGGRITRCGRRCRRSTKDGGRRCLRGFNEVRESYKAREIVRQRF